MLVRSVVGEKMHISGTSMQLKKCGQVYPNFDINMVITFLKYIYLKCTLYEFCFLNVLQL